MKQVIAAAVLSGILATGTALAAEDHGSHQQPVASTAPQGGMPHQGGMQGMQGMQGMRDEHMKLMQEVKDRAEIEALMWRYVRALDSMDEQGYAAVFAEDGQFGTGANATKGRAALSKMVADMKKTRAEREAKGEPKSPPMYHTIFNHSIVFQDNDHATYHAYWATIFAGSGQATPARVAAVGRSVDELVRVDGQWLIASRNVAPQD